MRENEKKYTASNVQSFSYYSGSQITIWFGDIWVDDITNISFNYNQEKRPIYGYASQYFDSVAKGQIMVQGSFVVNFRQKGYISYIIDNLPKLESTLKSRMSGSDLNERLPEIQNIIALHLKNGTFGPKTYSEIVEFAERPDFFQQAKLYEDAVWGADGDSDNELKRKYVETPDVVQHNEFPNGFDILITYGDVSTTDIKTLSDMVTSTVKVIKGVHLMGASQVIASNGEPVQEAYSFFARGMDGNV